ncbi:MAG: ABC transporter substrate-binding protein [Chloroflexota bacterium]
MTNKLLQMITILLLSLLFAVACQAQSTEAPVGGESSTDAASEEMATDDPILVGHLTYHTGAFGAFGEFFDAVTDFTLEIINEDPPLGREMVSIHQDIGTIGEAQAARKLIDSDGVDVLLNPAHEYFSYREWMVQYIADNNAPLMPSVHGGAIEREVGGVGDEPLFRGSPMDSALGVSAVLQAHERGAESIVIVAVEIAGSQLQKDAASSAADQLGITVADIIDIQPEQPTYRSEVTKIESAAPDAVIMFSPPEEGGTLVKNAAESGLSLMIIGTNEWQEQEFIKTATMDAVNQHELVGIVSFAHADSPAWDFYEPLWSNSGNAELGGADNSYTMQYYDLLVVTALAIEAAGSTHASDWAAAVPSITSEPGTVVYTYQDGITALRAGEEINYSGVTGEVSYTDTGVVSGLFGIIQWVSEDDFELVSTLDDATILALDSGTYQE